MIVGPLREVHTDALARSLFVSLGYPDERFESRLEHEVHCPRASGADLCLCFAQLELRRFEGEERQVVFVGSLRDPVVIPDPCAGDWIQ